MLAGAPWPLAVVFGHGGEARWGPPGVLATVAEILPYRLGEVERIVAAAPDTVPFGRVATDAVRVATVGRDRTLPLRELFQRVVSGSGRWKRRLAEHTTQLGQLLGVQSSAAGR